jgi:hypothetical protein
MDEEMDCPLGIGRAVADELTGDELNVVGDEMDHPFWESPQSERFQPGH